MRQGDGKIDGLTKDRWVKLRVSSAGLRTIDKNGIDVILAEIRHRGEKV